MAEMTNFVHPAQQEYKPFKPGYFINSIIGLALIFGFGFLPAIEPLTPLGMKLLGIFLGMVYLFTVCDVTWPSIAAIIALGLSGYCTINEAIAASMGHPVVFQSIMAYLVTGAMQYYGVAEFVARWIISRKCFRGRPMVFTYAYFLAFTFVCIIINSVAMIFLGWTILYGVYRMTGYKRGDKYVTLSLIGLVLSFMMGGAVVPFRSWQYSLVMQYGEAAGIEINFAVFMAVGAIITFGTITLYTLAMKYVFKTDFSKLRDFDPQSLKSEYAHMNKRQTIVLVVNAVVIGVILLASIVPSSSFIYEFFNNTLSTAGIYGIGAIALCLIPLNKKRQPLIEFFDVAAFSMRWEVILMVGATMAVSSAVISEQSGLLAFASTALGPLFVGKGPIGVLLIVILLSALLTNIGSNIGFGALLIPMVTPFLAPTGANPVVVGIALIYVVNMGLILPGASAPAAIIHSNTEWMDSKEIYKVLCFSMALTLLVAIRTLVVANAIV